MKIILQTQTTIALNIKIKQNQIYLHKKTQFQMLTKSNKIQKLINQG